jgi:hypothetical protein
MRWTFCFTLHQQFWMSIGLFKIKAFEFTSFLYLTPPVFLEVNRVLQIQDIRLHRFLLPYRQLPFQNILHDLPAQEVFRLFKALTYSLGDLLIPLCGLGGV